MPEKISIEITGDAKKLIGELKKSGVQMKEFGKSAGDAEKSSGKFAKGINTVSTAAAALGLAGVTATVGQFVTQSFKAASAAERLGKATENLAKGIGETGDSMVDSIQRASQGTISQMAAMEAANKAMMFGLVQNGDQMGELTQIAVTLGQSMGQNATKSIDDLTTALGRQSPMILDNLGITLKLEDAYRIYAESLGVTVDQLTEQEKKQAFVNAALIKGREQVELLGGVSEGSASDAEKMTASWSDFQVSFGRLLTTMEQSLGLFDSVTAGVNKLADGAKAWGGVFDNVGKINDAHAAALEKLGIAQEDFSTAMRSGQITGEQYQAALAEVSAEAVELEDNQRALSAETARWAGVAAQAAEAATQEGDSQRALAAETARWQGVAGSSRQILEEIAQGHTMTAREAEEYADAQRVAAEAEAERLESTRNLASTMAGFFTSMGEMQNTHIQREANFAAQLGEVRGNAGDAIKEQEQALSDELAEIEKKRAEKIHWVQTGAHDRTAAENEAALGHWNEHFDKLVEQTETKYGEQTEATKAKLQEREQAIAAAQAKEQAEFQKHVEELKLKAALGVLEATGQLEQMTGGIATSAGEAAELIRAGVIPVTDELGVAIQGALGELATANASAAQTAGENSEVLKQAFSGSLEPASKLTDQVNTTTSAVQGLNEALGSMGGGGGIGGGGGGGGEGEGESEGGGFGGGGGGFSGLVSSGKELNRIMAEQLPTSLIVTQEALTTTAETATAQTTLMMETLMLYDEALLKIAEETLPLVDEMNTTTATNATANFTTTKEIIDEMGKTGLEAGSEIAEGQAEAQESLNETGDVVATVTEKLAELVDMANAAASALNRAGGVSENVTGTGFAAGTPAGGFAVPSGFPNDSFVAGFTSGERLFVQKPGESLGSVLGLSPISAGGTGGGGGSARGGGLVIQGDVVIQGVNNPRQLFEQLQREARARGRTFASVN